MSSVYQNLSKTAESIKIDGTGLKIGIATADWNQDITYLLRDGAVKTLLANGVHGDDIRQVNVPGAFELPIAARLLLQSERLDGVICLGCVIKGETKHDEYINNAVANGIMQLSLTSGKPVIFGVLTPNNMEQAIDRAGGAHGNKGDEAAMTLLQMINLAKKLAPSKKGIGF
jgi:6,7-dimethyl-8-ribityllumazine synthase